MPATLSRTQVRDIDRRAVEQYGLPGLVLMENAGRGVADVLCQLGIGAAVAICCGCGNNGGDGFVVARHLDLRGHAVRVLLCGEVSRMAPDARVNYEVLLRSGIAIQHFSAQQPQRLAQLLQDAGWIVDALLGTGAAGEPRPPLPQVIDLLNQHPAPKLAIDVPSGLDCDTGQAARHTIAAAHTCTFVAAKPGFLIPSALQYTGQLHILDIGAPRDLIESITGQENQHADQQPMQ